MAHKATSEQRNERLRSFVLATREMIENEDFDNIHIRRIADKAGFHNSTLYSYFKDSEYLISLASVKVFEEYRNSLAELSKRNLSEHENFMEIWKFFCLNAFKFPEIYNNFFFGKHSDDLTSIFEEYYRIFPDEEQEHSASIHKMYVGKNLNLRCYDILEPLVGFPNIRLNKNNLILANNLIIASFKSLLEEALTFKSSNTIEKVNELTSRFMATLCFIIEK